LKEITNERELVFLALSLVWWGMLISHGKGRESEKREGKKKPFVLFHFFFVMG
jgi:hypothetical protein